MGLLLGSPVAKAPTFLTLAMAMNMMPCLLADTNHQNIPHAFHAHHCQKQGDQLLTPLSHSLWTWGWMIGQVTMQI